ncbi:hypothetical protein WN55_07960 [Dufourea novaeangliae]|uniref:Uncharacterized protein n=1 Tax=Dufourea novaeangliae TaxID=178035 RepID=A0A154P6M3_DUFNO|nr:hypothetical protein WN55_07960 [Dufourea novaeangliae]
MDSMVVIYDLTTERLQWGCRGKTSLWRQRCVDGQSAVVGVDNRDSLELI